LSAWPCIPAIPLTLSPLAPDDAVRAAILLRAAVAGHRHVVRVPQKELAELYRQRSEIVTQKEGEVAAEAAALAAKRMKLDAMIETKTSRQTTGGNTERRRGGTGEQLGAAGGGSRALFAKLAEERSQTPGRGAETARLRKRNAGQHRRNERQRKRPG